MPRRHVVIGTAGHIDHGKTALVKLLTDVDTDRLKEEKERGISIDLGFAHLRLPSGIDAGIVDVPGHERFVKTMLAGAGGIDVVLFVVAADEGVMPQTSEHLEIVNILQVNGGVIALTKSDLADEAWLDMVRADVKSLVKGTILQNAPIVPVSSVSGSGRREILTALDEAALNVKEKPTGQFARLPVDRVFTVEGFGTVVTGTLWSGRIAVGDSLDILPAGKNVRVRNVQVFGDDMKEALPGQRVALALHGVSREELDRGYWVVTPGAASPGFMVDVRFELLEEASRPLKNRSRVRFHLGASEVIGRIYFLDREELQPGEGAFAQLRLESPAVSVEGDRFVLRSYSPQLTIGGGSVLVPNASKHRKKDSGVIDFLALVEEGSPLERIEHAVRAGGKKGVGLSALAREAGVDLKQAEELAGELTARGRILKVGDSLVHADTFSSLKTEIGQHLKDYQRLHRLRWGMTRGELRKRFDAVTGEIFSAAVDSLVEEGKLFKKEDRYRADSQELALTPEEAGLKAAIEKKLLEVGFGVPLLKELASSEGIEKVTDILGILVEEGVVVKVTSELYFHSANVKRAEELLKSFLSKNGKMQVTDFKNLIESTRKYAVPLLEHFDRKGVTKRQGDTRILSGKGIREQG